jgi:hypothetical protein
VHVGLHAPEAHAVVPCPLVHVSPHAPQFALVSSATSHPFATFLSQSPKFVAHVIEHAPSTQLAAPLLLLQTFPHAPQLFTFVCVFTSQPLPALPSQLPKPAVHVPSVHTPAVHASLAFARSHTAPHDPQSESVVSGASHPVAA